MLLRRVQRFARIGEIDQRTDAVGGLSKLHVQLHHIL